MNKEERKVVPFNKPKEITSPEEYVRRFRDLFVSISEPEHFMKTIELLNKMEIGGVLVYSTYSETDRGLFVSHIFDQVNYDEQELTVTFINTKGHEEGFNTSEFTIPIEKIEGANGYISIEDGVEEEYYCLNICVPDGNIDVVWNC